ncbi:MAG: class I SAM-dependent methyltransferase [Alphaproteobacteria bacterium]|nr:class I SAM-dependent methyltransferase [Alphaproteobacteria bacterium]
MPSTVPPGAKVTTLTLGPGQHGSYKAEGGDDEPETRMALVESTNTKFLYSESEAEPKITQLFGDSKEFDPEPWLGRCDLVFVDGSHAYSYVVSDTQKALAMVKPGGLVLWHDYRGPRRIKGVWKALNELADRLDLKHVKDTSLIVWRRPA